jgi:hypothetical protein
MEKMMKGDVGQIMQNLEDKSVKENGKDIIKSVDPLLSRNSDLVIELAAVEGFQGLSKQKTFMP